jgi:uncharacterized protein (DUF488 family)
MLFTIGHSNRSFEDLAAILKAHGIELLADIRTVPKSRHNPQFNREALAVALPREGVAYIHIPELGGLRHPRKDSINDAWRNASFRGYADYMQTPEFAAAIDRLLIEAAAHRTAIMCAESVPWRCHRSLVADAVTARGVEVRHIMSATAANPHKLTPFAQVEGEQVSYPGIFPRE